MIPSSYSSNFCFPQLNMSSIPSSSVNTPSSISTSSSFEQKYSVIDDIEPRQTENLEAFLKMLDHRQVYSDIVRLTEGKTNFQRLFTIDHIHSTIRRMEREIRLQKIKATALLNDLIEDESSKRLRRYLRKDRPIPTREQKLTPPPSTILSSSPSPSKPSPPPIPTPKRSPKPLPIPPPQSQSGSWKYPIIISDDEEEFPTRDLRRSTPVVNDWEGEVSWDPVMACSMCGSTLHPSKGCRMGMKQDPETGYWYYAEDYNVNQA